MSGLTKIVNSVPFISALTLSACQGRPDRPDTILVDYKCSQLEINLITKAMDEWSEAADSAEIDIPLSLNFNSDEDPYGFLTWERGSEAVIYKIETTNPGYPVLKEEMGTDYAGASKEFIQIVFVEDNIRGIVEQKLFETYEEAFYKIALHEFGHFFGLADHLSSPHSVMAGQVYAGVETCIDEETLEYYCTMNQCGSNKHPTCKYKIEE
ncbi:MAG: hypothetical protein Q7S55_02440 [Nanoarchaeota archaeon]|nr:hypothetical protein [Nanoarchaeota archaeon]